MPAHPLAFSSQWFKNGEIVQQIMCTVLVHQSPQGLKSSKIKILKKNLRECGWPKLHYVSISMSVRLVQCPSVYSRNKNHI